ncbi:MAG: molybdenum cofactor biosynthesis protein MoaE [Pseudomonadota bacterium]
MDAVRVQTVDFDPGAELERLRRDCGGRAGALVSFTGLVRDLNDGARVSELRLEHYPGMTEKVLAELAAYATAQWSLVGSVIIHRVGPLKPNERIVFVAVASAHRQAAFQACAYLIDELKQRAPFWKQEATPAGARWVTAAQPRED